MKGSGEFKKALMSLQAEMDRVFMDVQDMARIEDGMSRAGSELSEQRKELKRISADLAEAGMSEEAAQLDELSEKMGDTRKTIDQNTAASRSIEGYSNGQGERTAGIYDLAQSVDRLVEEYEKVDTGIGRYAEGMAQVLAGYSSLIDGAYPLAGGSEELLNGSNDLYGGTTELYMASSALCGGTGEMLKGTGELRKGVINGYEIIDTKIDDVLGSINGGTEDTRSFVSPKTRMWSLFSSSCRRKR